MDGYQPELAHSQSKVNRILAAEIGMGSEPLHTSYIS